ncbi:MAG: chromate resistance protein ChrB domain-containing protein [Thermodesulfobacteriota bacterium]
MTSTDTRKWLLLIHQIPPKPDALRVKIWRRLQQVGAVAIKQSVYVMPLSEIAREDLSWTLKEIVAGGGDGSLLEARFVEGLSDNQILTLFHNARKSDYEKLIQEAKALLTEWSSTESDPRDPAVKRAAQLTRLKRRLDEISAIDFFQAPDRSTAELHLRELESRLSGQPPADRSATEEIKDLTGKTWVTRANLFVDRIACGWLIRRFVDPAAAFKFVREPRYRPGPGEIRFDMFEGEYTHEGDRCTFEVMIQRLQLQDHAVVPMAEIVHDLDLKDGKYGRSEISGLEALLTGLTAAHPDDDRRMTEGYHLFDNLYSYFKRRRRDPAK